MGLAALFCRNAVPGPILGKMNQTCLLDRLLRIWDLSRFP